MLKIYCPTKCCNQITYDLEDAYDWGIKNQGVRLRAGTVIWATTSRFVMFVTAT